MWERPGVLHRLQQHLLPSLFSLSYNAVGLKQGICLWVPYVCVLVYICPSIHPKAVTSQSSVWLEFGVYTEHTSGLILSLCLDTAMQMRFKKIS